MMNGATWPERRFPYKPIFPIAKMTLSVGPGGFSHEEDAGCFWGKGGT